MKYIYGILFICIIISTKAQNEVKRPNIPGDLMVDIGFNVWSSMPGTLERKIWSSKSVGIYYTKRKIFNDKLSFNYGLGFGLEKMSLGDASTLASNEILGTDSLAAVAIIPNTIKLKKNKLATVYLDIPFELRFHPKGTEDGEGFFIGVGGIVGVRLKAYTKWKYTNNGETTRRKQIGKYNLNQFRYGYQIRIGFKGVHLFYKKYLSNVFKDSFQDGTNPVMTTIGINVTGF